MARSSRDTDGRRRGLLLWTTATLLLAGIVWAAPKPVKEPVAPSAAQAAQWLAQGNQRYCAGKPQHPRQDAARRGELVAGQHPFAVVLSCADSRVPPEVLFDQGLGDLFVVRTAGEVVDNAALGSLEYGAEHLHVPLLLVLGHERCGAVAATLEAVEKGGTAEGGIGFLINAIKPAVVAAKDQPGEKLHNCVIEQVRRVMAQLTESKPILAELAEAGKLKIVGAVYGLETGAVEFLK